MNRVSRLGFAAAAVAWFVVLPLAPAAAATPHAAPATYAFAALAYAIGGVVCHQQAARSFLAFGVQLPVCARCTGIYLGAAVTAVWWLAGRPFGGRLRGGVPERVAAQRVVLLAACVPIALTLAFEWTTGNTPSNLLRAASGAPLGAAVAWAILATDAIH